VIAKRATGLYYSGKRTCEWLKFKAVHEQEVVIGYTEPRKSRKYFGSLVLAVRDKVAKRWVYAGRVGTGFDQAALKSLYGVMQALRTDKKPFDQKVKEVKAIAWLMPTLVGEVKFTEWTSEGEMRHPVFLGLRSDKSAADVLAQPTRLRQQSAGARLLPPPPGDPDLRPGLFIASHTPVTYSGRLGRAS